MQTSPTIGALVAALAAARADFRPVTKNRTVSVKSDRGSYKFAYATADELAAATDSALSAHGLALIQSLDGDGDSFRVSTMLAHASGEWLRFDSPPMPRPVKQQELGSAITYQRRYGKLLVLDLCAEDDDDGNAADGNAAEVTRDREPAPRTPANDRAGWRGAWDKVRAKQAEEGPIITPEGKGKLLAAAKANGWDEGEAEDVILSELLADGWGNVKGKVGAHVVWIFQNFRAK